MPKTLNIRLGSRSDYARAREEALRALDAAGISYHDAIKKGVETEKQGLRDYEKRFRDTMMELGEDAIDTFHDVAIGTARELGAHGGIGAFGEDLARTAGGLLGQGIGKGIGLAMGVDSGPWKGIAEEAGKFLGTQFARSFERYESLRMLGAKRAAAMTGGTPTGGENFYEMGRQYTLQSLDVRSATGETTQAVDEVVTQLSRVGIKFNEVGKGATTYALAADRLLNLEKGLTAELETNAVQRYGEAWSDVTEVIQDTTSVTQYWQAVAERTGSVQATALASNQNLLNMYKQMMEATKGTSFSMTGLSAILAGAVNVFGKTGLRPEMIGSMAAEFVSKIAPKVGGMEETIKQGFFLREILNATSAGRRINSIASDITKNEQLDPLLSNIGLSIFLARDKAATEDFGTAFLESLTVSKEQFPGTPEQKNTLMVLKMAQTTGMSEMGSALMMTLANQYTAKLRTGMSPSQAMKEAGRDDAIQALAGQLGMHGLSGADIIARMQPLAQASMSTEQKLSLATERMINIHQPDAFWGNMSKSIVDGLQKASQKGTGEGTGMNIAMRAAEGVKKPEAGIIMPKTEAERHRERYQARQEEKERTHKQHVVSSYTTSPGHGARQVNIAVNDAYFASDVNAIAAGIASVESRGKGDPYSKQGPLTNKGDRAYGKYQIMGANIPQWTEQAGLGRMTPEQFLASPEAQEKTAKHKLQEYYAKYGNVNDVASMWHAGIPLSQAVAQQRHDSLGTYTSSYARRVNEFVAASRLRG